MSESHDETDPAERPREKPTVGEGEQVEQAHTGEESEVELGAGKGPAEADTPGAPDVLPGPGGYAGRDPATEMPRIPTVPETQDDPKGHDAAPSEKGGDRDPSE